MAWVSDDHLQSMAVEVDATNAAIAVVNNNFMVSVCIFRPLIHRISCG